MCLIEGVLEYNFIIRVNFMIKVWEFVCECKGKLSVFIVGVDGVKCILNYWVCV